MARMIPAQISSDVKSSGEIEIFRRLQDDPKTHDWTVLHSLDITNHKNQIWGEIDFVIIIPTKGVLCLEVKATKRVRRDEGLWYYGNDPKPDTRGPFKQSSEAMHSLRKCVTEKAPDLAKIVFWSAVIFPYTEFNDESTEWHKWQVVDSKQYHTRSIGQILAAVLSQARLFLLTVPSASWFRPENNGPDLTQVRQLADILRPNFEFFESPESRRRKLDIELKVYTSEQFDALDAMIGNPRTIFHGPAGTGKTLLALEAARRSKKKTIFLCFNRLLGNWLKSMLGEAETSITVNTLHGFMLSAAGISAPENASDSFWTEDLPNLAMEKLIDEENGKYVFDQLIVDEAQDIIRPAYLDFLDLALSGGLFSGYWQMFGDFEKQSIFESPQDVLQLINERFASTPKYSLRVNCRNTPRIADFVQLFGDLEPGYSRVRRPDNNITPEIKAYKNDKNQEKILLETISKLAREGYKSDEIIVLSNRNDENSVISRLTVEDKFNFCSLRSQYIKGKIRHGTIHSFKGLEAPVVILTDIGAIGTEKSKSLFYIGVTRAISKVIVLVNELVQKEMLDIWSKF